MNKIDFAFLDSGTGGIPYMLYLREKIPSCNCVYLGDTAHFPYGQKSPEEITECAALSIDLILKKWNPKTIVIGCNTISVTALDELRKLFPLTPIVGTVPAIKLAASVTKNKRIGLLATNATVKHPYCQNLINNFASDCKVFSFADPDLISFVEKNLFKSSEDEKIKAVLPDVNFFKQNDCDVIILGCTHFTHLAKEFALVASPEIQIVDSREGVVKQAIRVENSSAFADFENSASLMKNLSASSQSFKSSAEIVASSAEVFAKKVSTSETSEEVLPLKSFTFFVTKANQNEINEYKILCENLNIPWGGVIS